MAAGKDAGRMADAALHSMGRCMGMSPRSGAKRGVSTPGGDPQAAQTPSRHEQPPKEPASDAASSRELDTAAGVPLPGRPLLQQTCLCTSLCVQPLKV